MYFVWLWEVLKRAFTATPRMTDALQVLAASALPAVSTAFGVKFPQETGAQILAYIGMAALIFFTIRLFWAPYAIWNEQNGSIGELKLELSKPERLILENLAKHRARARAKLASALEHYQSVSYANAYDDLTVTMADERMEKIRQLQAEAGMSEAFESARTRMALLIMREAQTPNTDLPLERTSRKVMKLMQAHALGDITAESLALQLPPYTELEKQQ